MYIQKLKKQISLSKILAIFVCAKWNSKWPPAYFLLYKSIFLICDNCSDKKVTKFRTIVILELGPGVEQSKLDFLLLCVQ